MLTIELWPVQIVTVLSMFALIVTETESGRCKYMPAGCVNLSAFLLGLYISRNQPGTRWNGEMRDLYNDVTGMCG